MLQRYYGVWRSIERNNPTIRIDNLCDISLKTHQLSKKITSQMLQRYKKEKRHIST
jgi:hypothetical protein